MFFPILGFSGAPAFFADVVALLAISAIIAYLCYRLGLVPIVGFLIAGVVIGPNALGLVREQALVDATAEVGVILLLFTIGIEFSLEKLSRIRRLIFGGGGLQVGLAIGVVAAALMAFGIDWRTGIYTGCLVALSSTAIVMKLLADRMEVDTPTGEIALGILIFQDLAVVVMVLLIPMLGGGGEGGSATGIVWALAKAVGIIAAVLLLARRWVPKLLEIVARTCSPEIFLLTVIGIGFGTAYLTSLAGVSLALGAFLAGLLVSESRFSHHAYGEILPLQILFSATFFVSIGMLVDLRFVADNLPLVLGAVALVVVIKTLTTGISAAAFGYRLPTALGSALLLAQVGEFSFVLERAGRELGLFPAGMAQAGTQTFIASTGLLMVLTPFLGQLGSYLDKRITRRNATVALPPKCAAITDAEPAVAEPAESGEAHESMRDHVIIAGYGPAGESLALGLRDAGIPLLISTLNPEGANRAEADGMPVLRGDYSRNHLLGLAGAGAARALVVADDEPAMAHRVISMARSQNPGLFILARTHAEKHVDELLDAGANIVVSDERENVVGLLGSLLESYGMEEDIVRRLTNTLRFRRDIRGEAPASSEMITLSEQEQHSRHCSHTAQAQPVVRRSSGCQECMKLGDTWVHLRICMSCGHVGCCNTSKNKHATQHYHETGHPIMKSLEAGESWSWCYIDEKEL